MKKHPEKKFFPTGDVDQLQPVNWTPNNVQDKRAYLSSCIDQMFPNQFTTLEINKRLKNEEQRQKLKKLKENVFNPKKNIMTTLKEFGFKIITKFSQVKTQKNICYFNFRTEDVNKYVHKNLVKKPETVKHKGVDYWNNLDLTCKQHFKEKKGRKLFVNYIYKFSTLNEKYFTVKETVSNTTFTFPMEKLSHFSLPYALVIAFKEILLMSQ